MLTRSGTYVGDTAVSDAVVIGAALNAWRMRVRKFAESQGPKKALVRTIKVLVISERVASSAAALLTP